MEIPQRDERKRDMKKHVVVGMYLALCVLGAQAMQKNGEVWYDTAGHAVNAHGGGVGRLRSGAP